MLLWTRWKFQSTEPFGQTPTGLGNGVSEVIEMRVDRRAFEWGKGKGDVGEYLSFCWVQSM
jgi:hypothetical protein